jgi:hypothetical protein
LIRLGHPQQRLRRRRAVDAPVLIDDAFVQVDGSFHVAVDQLRVHGRLQQPLSVRIPVRAGLEHHGGERGQDDADPKSPHRRTSDAETNHRMA